MTTQNAHISRLTIDGSITESTGTQDANKVVKTNFDGKFHISTLDVDEILQTAKISETLSFRPADIVYGDENISNNVVLLGDVDFTNNKEYIGVYSNGTSQYLIFTISYDIPATFIDWLDDAVQIVLKTSSATTSESTFDITVLKNNSTLHNINGIGSSVNWNTITFPKVSLATCNPGDNITLVIKAIADEHESCYINKVDFNIERYLK